LAISAGWSFTIATLTPCTATPRGSCSADGSFTTSPTLVTPSGTDFSTSTKIAGCLLVAAVLFLAGPAYSADLGISKTRVSSSALGTRHHLGFWGENFPYGYRWSVVRACERREVVDTPRGPRVRRVWVCHAPRWLANR